MKTGKCVWPGQERVATYPVKIDLAENTDEMVLVRDIDLFSSCEHHILPILGRAHVAYIPDGKVIGLSKIARIWSSQRTKGSLIIPV